MRDSICEDSICDLCSLTSGTGFIHSFIHSLVLIYFLNDIIEGKVNIIEEPYGKGRH